MDTIRYGIIGCGSMGREHLENLRAMGGAQITAIADPHEPSRQQASSMLNYSVHLFVNHRDLLSSGLCDALVIASPNHTHITVMRDALATDLPILCEKPLVTQVEDGLELLRLAHGRKSIAWVAQEYRYMPPVAEMIRTVHSGRIGTLHQVAIREHRQPFYPKVDNWNRFSVNTGGTMVEKCCHYFNLMELILGEKAKRVYASGGQRVNHLNESYNCQVPDILDSAYAIVEYPSGARASLDLCMFAEASLDNEHIVVVGDAGKMESFLPSGELRLGLRSDYGTRSVWGTSASEAENGVQVRRVRDTSIKYLGHHFGASYVEHVKFAQAVREGRPAEITLAEGLRAVATGLAAHRSINLGRPVALDELLPAENCKHNPAIVE